MSRGIFIQYTILKRRHNNLRGEYADTVRELDGQNSICECLCKILDKEMAKNIELREINKEMVGVLEKLCKDCANKNEHGECDLILVGPCSIYNVLSKVKGETK